MKPILLTILLVLAVIVVAQLGYLISDVHRLRMAQEDQKKQESINRAHFISDQDLLAAKFKVEADFQPLNDKSEELEHLDSIELGKAELHELRLIRAKVDRESAILELHLKYIHEAW